MAPKGTVLREVATGHMLVSLGDLGLVSLLCWSATAHKVQGAWVYQLDHGPDAQDCLQQRIILAWEDYEVVPVAVASPLH
eukprot:4734157-Lingulodinium_polyedra.AAC.1